MPNWCKNHLKLSGNEGQIKKFIEEFTDEEMGQKIATFNKLIPMPSELEDTTSPTKTPNEILKKKYGADNWFDWRYDNWGVKWDISESYFVNDINEVEFNTPWGPPVTFFKKVSKKFKHITFKLQFADEFFGQYPLGEIIIVDGEITHEDGPVEGTKEAEEVADEIWGGIWVEDIDL